MNRNRIVRWVLCAALALTFSTASFAQGLVSVRVGPPALPLYAQPLCPGPGEGFGAARRKPIDLADS